MPILLSTLTLGASLSPIISPLTEVAATDSAPSDIIHTEANTIDPFLRLWQIYFDNSVPYLKEALYVQNDSRSLSGHYLRRYVIAYFDYENGVTELEADRNLATLGEAGTDGWKLIEDYDLENTAQISGLTYGRKLYETNSSNKTGILYYAAQYGVRTYSTEVGGFVWSDMWWDRGKVNYRGCVQVEGFDSTKDFCSAKNDSVNKTVNYYVNDQVAPVENPTTWNEEWLEIQTGLLRELQSDWSELREKIEAGELDDTEAKAELDDIGERIEKLRRTLAKTYYAADLRSELEALKTEVEEFCRQRGWEAPEMGPAELDVVNDDDLKPVEPEKPGETDPANPTDPVNPNPIDPNPVNPDPVDPVKPDPANPTNPTDPTDPTDSTNPVNPTDPKDPVNPVNPMDPKPVTPENPNKPNPADPSHNNSGQSGSSGGGLGESGVISGLGVNNLIGTEQGSTNNSTNSVSLNNPSGATGGVLVAANDGSAVLGRSENESLETVSSELTEANRENLENDDAKRVEVPRLGGESQGWPWWLWLVPGFAIILLILLVRRLWRRD